VTELKRQQKQLEKELEERERQLKKLELENMEMKNQLTHVQSDYRLVNDDYRTLVQIMERARRMALLGEDIEEDGKYQIEESDNLEHVDK
jgi:prespore-specific regulator